MLYIIIYLFAIPDKDDLPLSERDSSLLVVLHFLYPSSLPFSCYREEKMVIHPLENIEGGWLQAQSK